MNVSEPEERVFSVPEAGIGRLDVFLSEQMAGFSRTRVQGLIKSGFVQVAGEVAAKSTGRFEPGTEIVVFVPPPVPAVPEPQDIPLDVIYEDDDLIVVNKPAGLVVHPAPGHFDGTLVNALLHHCPKLAGIGGVARPGIVHRLDQDTSGLLAVAKSERAMAGLTRAFADHRGGVSKVYLALVHGRPVPAEGHIENLIGRSPYDRKKMAIVEKNGKPAITDYRVVKTCGAKGNLSLVECTILTGRTHQIRVHLSALGTPVAGDRVYGRAKLDAALDPPPARQLLHAWHLKLRHPVSGAPLAFEAPLPADFNVFSERGFQC